jgi:Ion channel
MQALTTVAAACALLIVVTTVLHYEMLRLLSFGLPRIQVRPRAKLLVIMFSAFAAHIIEIVLYGLAAYFLVHALQLGSLVGAVPALKNFLYFSAETYTSLGFGDIVPGGPLRLLAGVEALNGLLLIGWSASYVYIAMERFWGEPGK